MKENRYWLGLEQLEAEDQPTKDEFGGETLADVNKTDDPAQTSRRDFLKYMGFGLGAATVAAGCEAPVIKSIPFLHKPEEVIPGVALYYASSFMDGSDYCSVLVKTRDGRPIKIEGNKHSKVTRGGTSAMVQASVLGLYDENRLQQPQLVKEGMAHTFFQRGKTDDSVISWKAADKKVVAALNQAVAKGKKIAIVSSSIISPSTKALIDEFAAKYPGTVHVSYDAVSYSAIMDAHQDGFGQRVLPSFRFDRADVIASFDADFLGTWLSPVEFTKQYMKGRKLKADAKKPKMSRHFHVESTLTLTGSAADIRTPLKPSEVGLALIGLYNEIAAQRGGGTINANVPAQADVKKMAKELMAAPAGKALVVCGINHRGLQLVCAAINDKLGSYGSTVDISAPCHIKSGNDAEFAALISEMNAGNVGVLMNYNCNPAFDNAMAAQFNGAMSKVPERIMIHASRNETLEKCTISCPDHHWLESWSDAEPYAGHLSICQPTIDKLYNTRQFQDSLLAWMGNGGSTASGETDSLFAESEKSGLEAYVAQGTAHSAFYGYLRKRWESTYFPRQSEMQTFVAFWDRSVQYGVTELPKLSLEGQPSFAADAAAAGAEAVRDLSAFKDLQLSIYQKVGIGDGRGVDNPWLQEMPDPISKATWDNYAMINKDDASDWGVRQNDVITVSAGGYSVSIPALVQPGQARGTVSIATGYGRQAAGKAGMDDYNPGARVGVGQNVMPFAMVVGGNALYAANIEVTKTGDKRHIAQTQTHHVINSDYGNLAKRTVIKEGNLENIETLRHDIQHQRDHFKHLNEKTLYPGYDHWYKRGHHWKMSIDLNSCTGCGACTVACTAENNVPVVGRTEVIRVHEMHWIRIDRYYTGDNAENPDVVFQPMMCQHCDNAPCENVCPVSATNHSSEGLNQMAYNRCFGTRYCANNCPYKVRRFNWYDYMDADSFPWNEHSTYYGGDDAYKGDHGLGMGGFMPRMVLNPDVTIRSRGVMEKCSFCVQRLQEGKLAAKKEGRRVKDGEILTACAQACPADAIKFGDNNDPNAAVRIELEQDHRAFFVIEEVNTDPSVGYLAKVRNRTGAEDAARRGVKETEPSQEHHA